MVLTEEEERNLDQKLKNDILSVLPSNGSLIQQVVKKKLDLNESIKPFSLGKKITSSIFDLS